VVPLVPSRVRDTCNILRVIGKSAVWVEVAGHVRAQVEAEHVVKFRVDIFVVFFGTEYVFE